MKGKGIIAVYLAAGRSSRMGLNKLALPLGAKTIGNSALQKALKSDLDYTIVVTREGDSLKWIDILLFRTPLRERWKSMTCQDAACGQAHSLQCGLRAAMEMKPKGIMILLADQPLISVKIINDLILRYLLSHQVNENIPFVGARFRGIQRPPIIFSPKSVPDLLKLEGDEGARQLIKKKILTGILVDYENDWDFFDVNTKEEYELLKRGKQ